MKNSRIRWYRCIRCILKHIIITNLHNISENMPTFVHQTLQVIGYDRFFYASIFNFAKHRHGTKRWKCMRNHAELVCGAKMKTADHKVTAPLIPRSGRQRPWLLAYPPTTGEPIFGEHEVNVPAIPRSSPRGGPGVSNDWCITGSEGADRAQKRMWVRLHPRRESNPQSFEAWIKKIVGSTPPV